MANKTIWTVFAAGTLVLVPGPAQAKEVKMQPQSEETVKSACDANAGTFWSGGGMYGCAKTCGDKTCGVICDKDTGCLGYTPGPAPTTRDPNALVAAINGTLKAEDEKREFEWGLLGLLGLLGLAGVAMRGRAGDRRDLP